ncbi:MAG: hypothetical protein HYV28_02685 [Ignavibacteriales bacterium]|nr:hypothetical protein [Ignavibacteriales bacterium]
MDKMEMFGNWEGAPLQGAERLLGWGFLQTEHRDGAQKRVIGDFCVY